MFQEIKPKCKAWENHSCQSIGKECSDCIITQIRSAGFNYIYFNYPEDDKSVEGDPYENN